MKNDDTWDPEDGHFSSFSLLKTGRNSFLQVGRNRARPVRSCCARRAMRQRQPRPVSQVLLLWTP